MSLFNDHARCLAILDGGDEKKRQMVLDNQGNMKITFGKQKGKTFRDIFKKESGFVWWVCNKAPLKAPTLALFKKYCERMKSGGPETETKMKRLQKSFRLRIRNRSSKTNEMQEVSECPFSRAVRLTPQKNEHCRFCGEIVDVRETFFGEECTVCGFSLT